MNNTNVQTARIETGEIDAKTVILDYLHPAPVVPDWLIVNARSSSRIESIVGKFQCWPNAVWRLKNISDYNVAVMKRAFGITIHHNGTGYRVIRESYLTHPDSENMVEMLHFSWDEEDKLTKRLAKLRESQWSVAGVSLGKSINETRLALKIELGKQLLLMHMLAWPESCERLLPVCQSKTSPGQLTTIRQCLAEIGFAPSIIEVRYRRNQQNIYLLEGW